MGKALHLLETSPVVRKRSLILQGGSGRPLGGVDQNSAHSDGGGMKNKENLKRRAMEFLLKSWSGDQNIYINLRGGTKIPSNIFKNIFHPLPISNY